MQTCFTPLRYFLPLLTASLVSPTLPAQTVDCDTVQVVAQATATNLTCLEPFTNLTAASHPSALGFQWSGPGGFTSTQQSASWFKTGTYTLTVTGPHGCTAQASVLVKDDCTSYPLVPPECPNSYNPPAENCPEVCVRQFLPLYFPFSNANAVPGTTPPGFCGEVHNDQWFAFVANATAGVIVAEALECTNGDGIQMALFEDCASAPVACNGGPSGIGVSMQLPVSGLTIGKVYYLLIDGWIGDMCTYQFIFDAGICTSSPPTPPLNPALTGISNVCPGATLTYTFSNAPNATAFLWTAPPGTLIDGQPAPVLLYAPDGKTVTITFGDQPGFVAVRAIYYFYPPSAPLVLPVVMLPIPPTILPKKEVCFEDLPYTWEEEPFSLLSAPGTYNLESTPYQSFLGCDSIVKQQIVVLPPSITNIGNQVLCSGECFNINGNSYCESGNYAEVLESWKGCDSTVLFTIQKLNLVAGITGGGTLNCTTTAITLGSAPSPGIKHWFNGAGQLIGAGNTLAVAVPGTYVLQVTQTIGGKTCLQTDTIVVEQDINPATVSATGGTLTCTEPALALQGSAVPPDAGLLWTGPNGFTSTLPNPVVTVPGSYTLTATAPNGCTATATIAVLADQAPPTVTAGGGTLTCAQPVVVLSGGSGGNSWWTGPGGFMSSDPNPAVGLPGNYTLTVTAPNGCTGTDIAEVLADQDPPTVTAGGTILTCIALNGTLTGQTNASGALYEWTGPGDFISQHPSPTVAVPGVYTLTVTAPNGCTASATATVAADQAMPQVSATADTLFCTGVAYLYGFSNVNGAQYFWTGPNNYSSVIQQSAVTEAGVYTLTVLNPVNGCSSSASVQVIADQTLPDITVGQLPPACGDSLLFLEAASSAPDAAFSWAGPNQFTAQTASVTVTQAGWYVVKATTPNGCQREISILAIEAPANPQVAVSNILPVYCYTVAIPVTTTVDLPGCTFAWTGPQGFSSALAGPALPLPGTYWLTVTAPNTCTATVEAVVPGDVSMPDISANGGVLTCEVPAITLTALTNTPNTVITWMGGSFPGTQNPVVVSEPGTYTAVATASNGCTNSVTVQVIDSCLVVKTNGNLTTTPGLLVYPNASTGIVFVKSTDGSPVSAITLLRADGVLARRDTPTAPAALLRYDWSDLPAGAYMVSAFIKERWVTQILVLTD